MKTIRTVVLALVVSFLATFAVRGDMFGKTLSTALVDAAVVDTAIDVEAPVEAADIEALNGMVEATPVGQYLSARVGIDVPAIELLPEFKADIDSETLWLARGIYSETKRPEEQELVAWVIRNRMETGYRGNRSYQSVVTDPYQFSAFNPGTRTRRYYGSLTQNSAAKGWQKALAIAYVVRHAPDQYRPFDETTRHFYSLRSMVGRRAPAWSKGHTPVTPKRPIRLDDERFRFYANIA